MSETLKDILPNHLKKGLTPTEEEVLAAAEEGREAFPERHNIDHDNKKKWGEVFNVRAELLYWLCVDEEVSQKVHAKGININGVRIKEELNFNSAILKRPLELYNCLLEGGLILRDSTTKNLFFTRSSFKSIHADRLKVEGVLVLNDVKVDGIVKLKGAYIENVLDCSGAEFKNKGDLAFSADGLKVLGNLHFEVKEAIGEISISGSEIKGSLSCKGASFDNEGGTVFDADKIRVERDFMFDVKKSKGLIRLNGANVNGQLSFKDADIEGNINAENLRVKEAFMVYNVQLKGKLNVLHAKVGQFADTFSSWSQLEGILLTGFEYSEIHSDIENNIEKRIAWIRIQTNKYYHPQPYEQLAKVCRRSGKDSFAREVFIAQMDDMLKADKRRPKHVRMNLFTRLWYLFFGFFAGYGHKPKKPIGFLLAGLIAGFIFFSLAGNAGVMQPTKASLFKYENIFIEGKIPVEYPEFNAFTYSLDTLIPLLDLHQEIYYLPDVIQPRTSGGFLGFTWGALVRCYLWWHICAGWIFTSLAAVSIAKLARRE